MDDEQAEQADGIEPIGRATYSPEDNKIRVYPEGVRVDSVLDEAQYAAFKKAGFKWAAKQECFVCPRWTPTAEDWALRLCGEIEDEDYSALERSADRAERFEVYRDKRADEAGASADAFEAGPAAFGHQSRARAERQARRHDRYRVGAVSQWSKAEYWQQRTAGVIAHALYRARPEVRRGRIKTLEAEQRKHLKGIADAQKHYDAWKALKEMDGADASLSAVHSDNWNKAQRIAYTLAGSGSCWVRLYHPTCEAANAKAREIWKHGFSPYELLTKTEFVGQPFAPMTPRQVAALYLEKVADPSAPGKSWHRWSDHYDLRLAYERAMLANEGGTAAAVEIEPGGWICTGNRTGSVFTDVSTGWKQVQGVNRSPATGLITSVKVWGKTWSRVEARNGKDVLVSVNVERLGEDAYRAPTDEEREAFNAKKKAEKDARPTVPTINPTDEDAERLQAHLNKPAKKPGEIARVPQAKFSQWLKYEYVSVREFNLGAGPFKARIHRRHWGEADSVVILTDKPQKPLPIAEAAPAKPEPAADAGDYLEPVAGDLFGAVLA